MGKVVFKVLQVTFAVAFMVALGLVFGVSLLKHIADPPSIREVAICCVLAAIVGLWNYRFYMGPHSRTVPDGTVTEDHADGTQVCIYKDGTRITSKNGRLISFEPPVSDREEEFK